MNSPGPDIRSASSTIVARSRGAMGRPVPVVISHATSIFRCLGRLREIAYLLQVDLDDPTAGLRLHSIPGCVCPVCTDMVVSPILCFRVTFWVTPVACVQVQFRLTNATDQAGWPHYRARTVELAFLLPSPGGIITVRSGGRSRWSAARAPSELDSGEAEEVAKESKVVRRTAGAAGHRERLMQVMRIETKRYTDMNSSYIGGICLLRSPLRAGYHCI